MSVITFSATDVARNFSEYVSRVNYKGERFVLVKGGKEVAELKPVPKGRRLSELSSLLSNGPHLTPEEAASFSELLHGVYRAVDDRIRTHRFAFVGNAMQKTNRHT